MLEIDEFKATKSLQPGMDPELSYNSSGYYDPTMGVALSRIQAEEENRKAWLRIAEIEASKRSLGAAQPDSSKGTNLTF